VTRRRNYLYQSTSEHAMRSPNTRPLIEIRILVNRPALADHRAVLAGSRCALLHQLLNNDDAATTTAAAAGASSSGSREQLDSSVKYFDAKIERNRLLHYLGRILHWFAPWVDFRTGSQVLLCLLRCCTQGEPNLKAENFGRLPYSKTYADKSV
jgi:hypothetical protein